jgi:hypothetical protein
MCAACAWWSTKRHEENGSTGVERRTSIRRSRTQSSPVLARRDASISSVLAASDMSGIAELLANLGFVVTGSDASSRK